MIYKIRSQWNKFNKKAFTLTELLVVLTIIFFNEITLAEITEAQKKIIKTHIIMVHEGMISIDEVYKKTIKMLIGATKKLKVGLPSNLETDVGPLIDAKAKQQINNHLINFKNKILFDMSVNEDLDGFYVSPKIIEIDKLIDIKKEIFGPVLHVFKYSSNELEKLIEAINKMNYGLTLVVHSRIDNTINYIFKNTA